MAGTVGEPCVGGSVLPARGRIALFGCVFLLRLKGCADPSRRGDVSFCWRRSDGRRIVACLLFYNKRCRVVKGG